ncbi:hypothetical protein [Listeria seeligeri]|uniref:hypothetical protein n=1 Tax=Listeria seeligeri TaxID=1640 RepID=UPI0010BB6342|nr:hypothetical protein [Listeria seeligeri]
MNYGIEINGFNYPKAYLKAIELNLVDFDNWYFIEADQAIRRYQSLSDRFPTRKLVPFARKDDNDDIACFEIGKGKVVQIIHDFTTEGYEQRGQFMDLWAWMQYALDELIDDERLISEE